MKYNYVASDIVTLKCPQGINVQKTEAGVQSIEDSENLIQYNLRERWTPTTSGDRPPYIAVIYC